MQRMACSRVCVPGTVGDTPLRSDTNRNVCRSVNTLARLPVDQLRCLRMQRRQWEGQRRPVTAIGSCAGARGSREAPMPLSPFWSPLFTENPRSAASTPRGRATGLAVYTMALRQNQHASAWRDSAVAESIEQIPADRPISVGACSCRPLRHRERCQRLLKSTYTDTSKNRCTSLPLIARTPALKVIPFYQQTVRPQTPRASLRILQHPRAPACAASAPTRPYPAAASALGTWRTLPAPWGPPAGSRSGAAAAPAAAWPARVCVKREETAGGKEGT